MGRPKTALLTVAAVLMLLLAACGDTDAPAPRPIGLAKGDRYVAIGDSYTAAPRTGPAVSDDGCLQTTVNYPRLVAEKLDLDLTDVSCGGATTQNVTTPQPLGNHAAPPQELGLSKATKLVTISLGANDFNTFGAVVFFCGALRTQDPTGAPCTAEVNKATGSNSLDGRIAQIEDHLVAVIKLVEKHSPKARIVFVGYPQFFPPTGPCDQLSLADGDYALARRVNVLLVKAQKQAAARAKVDYLDVFTPTKGHDMCAADPWIAGGTPTRTDAAPFHPYPEEQRFVADRLIEFLARQR